MERAMSVEDKIRRAEERYYNKKRGKDEITSEYIRRSAPKKRDIKLVKKMIMQIITCLVIYSVFYVIINNNYIFSEDFTNKAREILSQDINFTEIYSFVSNKINEIFKTVIQDDEVKENSQNEDSNDTEKIEQNIQNNDENIGGAEEILTNEQGNVDNGIVDTQNQEDNNTGESQEEQSPQLSQMEQDANYIKSTVSFIKPINGDISSKFGERNPTTPTVPKNHTGTDIAASTGTKIVSATDGIVILASSKGDYGNHLQIQVNDVIVLYAHCNKLYVKEGDTIVQGQEIAEVGSTGNTTGPHLHFEVRYQNRYVDPQMILEL